MAKLQVSKTFSSLRGRNLKPLAMDAAQVTMAAVTQLRRLGLDFDVDTVAQQVHYLYAQKRTAGDAAFTAPQLTPSIPTPVQFLQTWLPGFVKILTSARKIDDLIGVKTVGDWEDDQIVQGIIEPSAAAAEYGDYNAIPLANWTTNFEIRNLVRGELGIAVGLLEEGRSAAMRVASAEEKRQSAAIGLEIMRNAIGFYGWNNGNNRTFGFLNDPYLPAYITAPSGGSGGWAEGTFATIQADLRAAIVQLRVQSQDQIDPEKVEMTLAIAMSKVDYLSVTTDFGVSVRDWLTQTYPKIRVVSAPELEAANAGQDVFYLFAEDIEQSIDGSTDGGETFVQLVQTKFITLGVEKRAKTYVEDYSNSTAGAMCKRPWAVVRFTDI